MVAARIVTGDLLDQDVEYIVNAWNRNIIPWWLLLPQGVSGAIKRRGGYAPFIELGRKGPIPPGGAVLTGAGYLPYRGIIHVAGINMWWRASAQSVQKSTASAMALLNQLGGRSIAFPVIGAGTGALGEKRALALMQQTLQTIESAASVTIVLFRKGQLAPVAQHPPDSCS